jgi:transcriptional regulator GlxA family with amidase domain
MAQTVGIYVFDEVEVLDFAGPFEVFSTASRVVDRDRAGAGRGFEVLLLADEPRTVQARGGFPIVCTRAIGEYPALDVLIVPGGVVTRELERPAVIAWIAGCARTTVVTASVCTGAFLLARAGLLDGRRATSHWEDIDDLRRMFPALKVEDGLRWIDEGPVVTSAGISAGIDMSLHLVERLGGEELALRTARQMDYDWRR